MVSANTMTLQLLSRPPPPPSRYICGKSGSELAPKSSILAAIGCVALLDRFSGTGLARQAIRPKKIRVEDIILGLSQHESDRRMSEAGEK